MSAVLNIWIKVQHQIFSTS